MDVNKEEKQLGEMIDVNQVINDTVNKLANVLDDPDKGSVKNLTEIKDSLQALKSIDKNVPYELFPSTIERLNKIKEELPRLEHEKNSSVFKPEKEGSSIDVAETSSGKEASSIDVAEISSNKEFANIEEDNLDKIIKTIDIVVGIKEKTLKESTEIEVSDRIINKAIENILVDVLEAAAKNVVKIGSTEIGSRKENQELEINPRESDKSINNFNSDAEKLPKEITNENFNTDPVDKSTSNIEDRPGVTAKLNKEVVAGNVEIDKDNNYLNNMSPEQQKLTEYILAAAQEEIKDPQAVETIRVSLDSYFRDENSIIDKPNVEDEKEANAIEETDKVIKEENLVDSPDQGSDKEINELSEVEASSKNIKSFEEDVDQVSNNAGEKTANDTPAAINDDNKELNNFETPASTDKEDNPVVDTPKEEGEKLTNLDSYDNYTKSDKNLVDPEAPGNLDDSVSNLGDGKYNNPTLLNSFSEGGEVLYDANPPTPGGDNGYNNKPSSSANRSAETPDPESAGGKYWQRYEDGKLATPRKTFDPEKDKVIYKQKTVVVTDENGDPVMNDNGTPQTTEEDTSPFPTGMSTKNITYKQKTVVVTDENGDPVMNDNGTPQTTEVDTKVMPETGLRKMSSADDAETAGTVGGFVGDVFGAGSGLFAYPLGGVYENFSGEKTEKRTLNFGERTGGFFDRVTVPDIPEGDRGKDEDSFQGAGSFTDNTADQLSDELGSVEKNRDRNNNLNYRKQDTVEQNQSSGSRYYVRNSISKVIIGALNRKQDSEYSKLDYMSDGGMEANDISFISQGQAYVSSSDPSSKISINKDAIKDRANAGFGNHPSSTGFLKIYQKRALDFEGTVENGGAKIMPFQFEPEYDGDGKKAEYSTISTLGRSAAARVYTKSNERTLSLTLTYIVSGPARGKEIDNEGNSLTSKGMKGWDEDYIYGYIIPNFRNLTKPNIGDSLSYRLAPPIVQVWYGGLETFQASSSGAPNNRDGLMDVPSTFLTTWFTADGTFKTYRSLWLAESIDIEYDGGIINATSKNKLIAKVNISLVEIAPSVVANETLHWWNPIRQ